MTAFPPDRADPVFWPGPELQIRQRACEAEGLRLNAPWRVRSRGTVARLARALVERCRQLTVDILALDKEPQTPRAAPGADVAGDRGCSTLTAGKIVAETVDVRRFR